MNKLQSAWTLLIDFICTKRNCKLLINVFVNTKNYVSKSNIFDLKPKSDESQMIRRI